MRNVRAMIMLGIAVVAGLVAVLLASNWLRDQTSGIATQIVIARTEIGVGERIGPQHLKLVNWPSDAVPPGAVSSIEALDGRVVKTNIQPNEPVTEARLAQKGTTGGLSSTIAEGKRAITVRVNEVVGVAGFALPGNYVDVIVNMQDDRQPGDRSQVISKMVLQKILVLAVAQETGRDETRPRVVSAVTLEVTPQEAEKIDLARSVGSLSLVLRGQLDASPAQTPGANKDSLLGSATRPLTTAAPVVAPVQPPPAAASAPAPKPEPARARRQRCVDTLVGATRKTECF